MPTNISRLTKQDVARMMDYAILQPYFRDQEQLEGCEHVRQYRFAAYYVLPHWAPLIIKEVGDFARENNVLLGTGIAFPYGSATTRSKLAESEEHIELGCTVLDMVANAALLKDGKTDAYGQECREFVRLCHDAGVVAKVIIQVGHLTDEEIVTATRLVAEAGADYVKTATGTGPSGRPNFHDARLILDTLDEMNSSTQMKVSGVVDPKIFNAYAFIRMGAALIGTRSAPQIVEALPEVQKRLYPGNV